MRKHFEAALFAREIQCIGATTPAEFRKSIEKDRSLSGAFRPLKCRSNGRGGSRNSHWRARALRELPPGALHRRSFGSGRYSLIVIFPIAFLPDKAIDVIDEAGARA